MSHPPTPTTIGPYTIEREIARGGMGVVYLAHDSRLDRTVAIKALPPELAENPERMARFEREARALAALNHTSVAGIHGVEELDGSRYLVLEYVDGVTLTERIEQGPLQIDEALEIAHQIAAGVEAAHEAGVIHRDLKPGNVIIRSDGAVKVVDFGLAKEIEPSTSSLDLSKLATVTARQEPATAVGQVLGTPAYLSPEQARGKSVDRRTDIWSFGCVLFECLSGDRVFGGETTTDSLAAILEREPDWKALPARTPPRIRELLKSCLEKNPRNRLRDIGDARLTIEKALEDREWSSTSIAAYDGAPARQRRVGLVAGAALAAFVLGAGAMYLAPRDTGGAGGADRQVRRYTIDVAGADARNQTMSNLTISSEGRYIAYELYDGSEREQETRTRVMVRDLTTLEPWTLPGLDRVMELFFSPDSRRLGFQTREAIKSVSINGGPATALYEVTEQVTSQPIWVDEDTIVRPRMTNDALVQLSLADQAERVLLEPNDDNGFIGIECAWPLPGGEGYLISGWTGQTVEDYSISHLASDGTVRRLLDDAASPSVIDGRYLAFIRRSTIFVAPFEPRNARLLADPVPVIEGVKASPWGGGGAFAISPTGDLVYQPGDRVTTGRRLVWVSAEGGVDPLPMRSDAYFTSLDVSSDGRYAVLTTLRNKNEMWLIDLDTMTRERLLDEGEPRDATISPDGRFVAYAAVAADGGYTEQNRISVLDARSRTEVALLTRENTWIDPNGWTPDGRKLVFTAWDRKALRSGIELFDPATGETESVLNSEHDEYDGRISPDGEWLLFGSDRSGDWNMFLLPFPANGTPPRLISPGGAYGKAQWSDDSRTVYYAHRDKMYAVDLSLENGLEVAQPREVFEWPWPDGLSISGHYAHAGDGRFLMIEPADWEKEPPRLVVVHNWIAELDRRFSEEN